MDENCNTPSLPHVKSQSAYERVLQAMLLSPTTSSLCVSVIPASFYSLVRFWQTGQLSLLSTNTCPAKWWTWFWLLAAWADIVSSVD